MVHHLVELLQELPVLADEVGFDLQAENGPALAANLGDLRQPFGRRLYVIRWLLALGMVKREPANQPRLKLASQIHGPLHVLLQVLVKRDVGIGRAVFHIEQLDLANRRAD